MGSRTDATAEKARAKNRRIARFILLFIRRREPGSRYKKIAGLKCDSYLLKKMAAGNAFLSGHDSLRKQA
jgi:hypothetical protein